MYKLSDGGKTVTFELDLKNFALSDTAAEDIESVTVTASFTLWRKNPDFEMKLSSDEIWTLTKPYEEVSAPGNIGFPEFNFLIYYKNGSCDYVTAQTPLSRSALKNGLTPCTESFGNNFVILTDKYFLPEIKEKEKYLNNIEELCNINLKNPQERDRISNVRRVPAAKNLWRGYHPYKKSRPAFSTENIRIKLVNKALSKNKIRSVITLCGDEGLNKELGEKFYHPMKKIRKAGNQLLIDTSYETVYFEPQSQEYGQTVKKIVDFIINHPAPFYIHCRLGSDRTGTMSSILAALCGASWKEITEDYEKTSKAGFGEFRSPRLLEYSYKKILGKSPTEIQNLQQALSDYFINAAILSQTEIIELRKKLTS